MTTSLSGNGRTAEVSRAMPNDTMDSEAALLPLEGSQIAPADIALRHHEGTLSVDWHTAPNGYEVTLYRGSQEMISKRVVNPPTDFATEALPAGTYGVVVKTESHSPTLDDGVTPVPSIIKLETPSNIVLAYDSEAEKWKVSWQEVSGATSYAVQIVQFLARTNDTTTTASYQFDLGPLPDTPPLIQAWVQAKGDEQHIDSNVGKSEPVTASERPIEQPHSVVPSPEELRRDGVPIIRFEHPAEEGNIIIRVAGGLPINRDDFIRIENTKLYEGTSRVLEKIPGQADGNAAPLDGYRIEYTWQGFPPGFEDGATPADNKAQLYLADPPA